MVLSDASSDSNRGSAGSLASSNTCHAMGIAECYTWRHQQGSSSYHMQGFPAHQAGQQWQAHATTYIIAALQPGMTHLWEQLMYKLAFSTAPLWHADHLQPQEGKVTQPSC